MARYPLAVWKPLSRRIFRSMPRPVRINLHTAVSNGSSLHTMFNRGGVASHFYIRKDGVVEQYVDTAQRAACDLDGNADTISIETWDGYPNGWRNDSDVPAWNSAQVKAIVALLQWIWRTHGTIPKRRATSNRKGIASHGLSYHRLGVPGAPGFVARPNGLQYSSSRGKICPGPRRIGQIPAIYAAAVSGAASPGVPSTPPASDPIEEFLMSEVALNLLNYISTQVKVTNQTAVDERKYIRSQLISIAEGSFGREAINARNTAFRTILREGLAEFAKQLPGVDSSETINRIDSKLDRVLTDLDNEQGAHAEKTIKEIINRLAPATDVMLTAAEAIESGDGLEESGV